MSKISDPALEQTPTFFEALADAAHCTPEDAVEHWYASPSGDGRLGAFLEEYATEPAGD